ncbi:hypothetical protein PR202_ga06892 [Eleusine coracana subsp. coracana]|uniref:Pectate lyase n=1 Tax=Eleusine coracana subsp. coracana TaxID=191504 RepID=A0AAV5BYH6_ELECO|nr:hypothetical protein PR202_ga06892 [Eleusine coracana subsp. coracana]
MERLRCSRRPGSLLLLAAAFLAAAAVSSANELDDHWQKRKEEAEASAKKAYKPDPFNVTNSFNVDVHRSESEALRRGLSGKKKRNKGGGPCVATNPIDRCWRCRADWATDRMRLARCAKGFGHGTTGGLGGKIYVVTDPTDADAANPRPGTLRWGAVQDGKLWITFARCRWGFFHVVNNDYTHWLMYAIGGGDNPTIISQGNRYIAPPSASAKMITKHYAEEGVWKNWVWHSENDLLMNDAIFQVSGGAVQKKIKKGDWIKPKPGSYVKRLTRNAGALSCRLGKPC